MDVILVHFGTALDTGLSVIGTGVSAILMLQADFLVRDNGGRRGFSKMAKVRSLFKDLPNS